MATILARFAYDSVYREFGDRAHEGFQELYPDVLRWLASRPRDVWPRTVLRVPHDGIMPLARRVFWLESDTRQGVVEARVAAPNRFEVEARRARRVTLYLHDRLVDLDRPIEISVNGRELAPLEVRRSIVTAIEQVRALGDASRGAAAFADITIPIGESSAAVGKQLSESLRPVHPEGRLSFWEYYAVNALVERFPSIGLEGSEEVIPSDDLHDMQRQGLRPANEIVGVRIAAVEPQGPLAGSGLRPGDLLLEVGGEPFFAGAGGLERLHHWMTRELTAVPRDYELLLWRDERLVRSSAPLALGPYRE